MERLQQHRGVIHIQPGEVGRGEGDVLDVTFSVYRHVPPPAPSRNSCFSRFDPEAVVADMTSREIEPDRETYQCLISR